jgi:hypothetical protein
MNSGTVLTGTEGCISMAKGSRAMLATGAMSRMKLKIELFIERRIDRVCPTDEEERVTIRRRTHHHLRRDIGACARPVLNDELLAKPFREPLANQTCDDIDPAAGGKADEMRTGRDG